MTWSLVTAADEGERCCVVLYGERCERRSVFRVGGRGLDDYTFTCAEHLELVIRPGEVAARLDGQLG